MYIHKVGNRFLETTSAQLLALNATQLNFNAKSFAYPHNVTLYHTTRCFREELSSDHCVTIQRTMLRYGILAFLACCSFTNSTSAKRILINSSSASAVIEAAAFNVTPGAFITSLFDHHDENGISGLSLQRLINITEKLRIGEEHTDEDHDDHGHGDHGHGDHGHGDHGHDDHGHDDHGHDHHKVIPHSKHVSEQIFNQSKCFSLDELRRTYSLFEKNLLTQAEFERLCPALIQQNYHDACKPVPPPPRVPGSRISVAQKYGYGTAAVVVVSVLSVFFIFIIPLFRKSVYEHLMQFLIALGVGTLSGDYLHLYHRYTALGLHSHDNDAEADEAGSAHLVIWRCVACLGAIYGFFLYEVCLHSFIHQRSKRLKGQDNHGHEHDENDHSHIPDAELIRVARRHSTKPVTDIELPGHGLDQKTTTPPKENVTEGHHHHNHHHVHDTICGLKPLAWMILIGDCLHNFADGLTLAAAYSIDVGSGISTTIAIFCHEVPHEARTGVSFRKAMVLNFLTAICCLGGFYAGIPIAENEEARLWIFIVAAGMFLYVALADMLPELKNGAKDLLTVVMQNAGLMSGFGIMLIIALFEDSIQI
ncbi:putative Zinc transporter ZIP12 [Hypsibius exemplaris]|uniref:Zinc transporter ZIP12 n=1 Tax=Hypsibius exemplaris TaxID=2072580 RepID=A0A1W0WWH9_HYPEX|nr:putative Zinc transporter ZIP12 [Hypsibius exemplaris]